MNSNDNGTPGTWYVRKREINGELVDCFVSAPDCQGFHYDAEILGDDEYRDSIDRKLADCELIVALVNARRSAAPTPPADKQDDEELDGTDAAHPAWWRGNDRGVDAACARIEAVLDGTDTGAGVLGGARLERLRRQLLAAKPAAPAPSEATRPQTEPAPADLAGRVNDLESSEDQLLKERDHAYDIIDKLCDAVLGPDREEWSSAYFFENAIEDVEDEIARLKEPAPDHIPDAGKMVEPAPVVSLEAKLTELNAFIAWNRGRHEPYVRIGFESVVLDHLHRYHPPAPQGDARDALCAALNFVSFFTSGNDVRRDPVYVARMHGTELTDEASALRDKLNAAIAAQAAKGNDHD